MRTTEEENMDYIYNYNDMQFFIETKNDIEERMLFRAENIWDDDKMEGKTSYNGNCSLHDIRKCTPWFDDGDYYRCNY